MSETTDFDFGSNWKNFLSLVDEERIAAAEESLKLRLGQSNLSGKTFLDIGCGSGLFSLAAKRMGARVTSFDFNPHSVACAAELKRRYYFGAQDWLIQQGSVLDESYLNSFPKFDIVYSWGVLHHTGSMWKAIEMASNKVKDSGIFFISIYNDQGWQSHVWRLIKRIYNRLPHFLRPLYVGAVAWPFELKAALFGRRTKLERGMSRWYDWVDWCGGYPFEVAKPKEIVDFLKPKGFAIENTKTTPGWGCNEFVFRRTGLEQ